MLEYWPISWAQHTGRQLAPLSLRANNKTPFPKHDNWPRTLSTSPIVVARNKYSCSGITCPFRSDDHHHRHRHIVSSTHPPTELQWMGVVGEELRLKVICGRLRGDHSFDFIVGSFVDDAFYSVIDDVLLFTAGRLMGGQNEWERSRNGWRIGVPRQTDWRFHFHLPRVIVIGILIQEMESK